MADTPRKARLSRAAEFDRVYRQGRSAQDRLLVVYRFERPEDVPTPAANEPRIGITISRKVGGAVVRNRLKRQLRDAFTQLENLDPDCDWIAIARPGLPERVEQEGFAWLSETLTRLVTQLSQAPTKR
jgi:ribonuclease P protein component